MIFDGESSLSNSVNLNLEIDILVLPIGSMKNKPDPRLLSYHSDFHVFEFDSEVGDLPEIIPLFSNADVLV